MSNRQNITASGSTQTPAYLELVKLGYDVNCDREWPGGPMWFATNDKVNLSGDHLVSVLGLHFLQSLRGSKWGATDQQINDFCAKFSPASDGDEEADEPTEA
jgi:hypothetical protein